MKSRTKQFIALFGSLSLFVSCSNNDSSTATTEEDSTTSATSQPSDAAHDTTANMNHDNMSSGMMSAMQPSMDKMKSMTMTGDFDIDFANMMIEHHQGGIDMSQMEISQGKDEKMKAKAQEILNKQKEEQQKLRDFVSSYKPSGMKHGEGELQKSMSTAMDQIKSMQMTGDVDKDFATMMMHHHQHGVSMAKMELANGMSEKLKGMAKKSIDDQQKDIKEFQTWLDAKK